MENDPTLLPLDPRGHGFDVVLRGYDRGQVNAHLSRLEEALQRSERRISELSAESARLRRELDQAQRSAGDSFEALGARLARILQLAEEEATDIRDRAQGQARTMLDEAEEDSTRARTEAEEEADRTVHEARRTADRLVADAEEQATRIRESAEREAGELLTDTRAELEALQERRDAIRAQLRELHERVSAAMSAVGDAGAGTVDVAAVMPAIEAAAEMADPENGPAGHQPPQADPVPTEPALADAPTTRLRLAADTGQGAAGDPDEQLTELLEGMDPAAGSSG